MVRVSRLKERLLERGISKDQIVADLDISTAEIEHYFKNIDTIPVNTLMELCIYLDCKPTELYEEVGTPEVRTSASNNVFLRFLKDSFIPKTMVMNNKYLYIFMLFVALLVIVTNLRINDILQLYPKNVFMIFAYRWTFIAVFLGLLLPLLFTSFWAYLLLQNGLVNVIFLLETIYLKEYGPTITSNTMYIVVIIVTIVLCIIYAIIINHLRNKLGVLNIKSTLKSIQVNLHNNKKESINL